MPALHRSRGRLQTGRGRPLTDAHDEDRLHLRQPGKAAGRRDPARHPVGNGRHARAAREAVLGSRNRRSMASTACTTGPMGSSVSPGAPDAFSHWTICRVRIAAYCPNATTPNMGSSRCRPSAGCPLRCDYCTYPLIEGRQGRLRDPGQVADEFMEICSRPGVEHLFIVDSVFNLPPRHARDVCR
jgi:hypothetical protein